MGIFSRLRRTGGQDNEQTPWHSQPMEGDGVFVIEDVFVITGRGPVFTGAVESGMLRVGDVLTLDAEPSTDLAISGAIKAIESRHRKSRMVVAGDKAGIMLQGVRSEDLPYSRSASGFVLDTQALRGNRMRTLAARTTTET
ncbi:hypothetical protein BPY_13330 [Bifidobacterium psychraerophilum]|uniref:hypothetical protein n=1 Tax=Bifidobacterium psychraerophilum TaxID=218140 RepID=UPI00310F551D